MLYYVPKPEEDVSDLVRTGARKTMSSSSCFFFLLRSLEFKISQRDLAGNKGPLPDNEIVLLLVRPLTL